MTETLNNARRALRREAFVHPIKLSEVKPGGYLESVLLGALDRYGLK